MWASVLCVCMRECVCACVRACVRVSLGRGGGACSVVGIYSSLDCTCLIALHMVSADSNELHSRQVYLYWCFISVVSAV